jgi:hypothetical protein
VIDSFTNRDIDRTRACLIVDEAIKVALKFVKVHRTGNIAAHKVAAFSRHVLSSGVLHYSVPTCVMEQVICDRNVKQFE